MITDSCALIEVKRFAKVINHSRACKRENMISTRLSTDRPSQLPQLRTKSSHSRARAAEKGDLFACLEKAHQKGAQLRGGEKPDEEKKADVRGSVNACRLLL